MTKVRFSNCTLCKASALWLILWMVTPSLTAAGQKSKAPEVVRSHVLKLGVGEQVRVRELSGTDLRGEIIGIGAQVFTLQQRDAAGLTAIKYSDVARISRLKVRGPHQNWSINPLWIAGGIIEGAILVFVICGDSGCNN